MNDVRCDFRAAADTVEQLRSLVDELAGSNHPSRLLNECLDEQLADLGEALLNFSSLDHARREQVRAVGYHRNYADAARNGIRALLATLAAGAVWYLSGWDQRPVLLAVLGPCCTFLIGFNTLVGTGDTASYNFVDFANQAADWS
ncbi:hypothetical protein CD58_17950 [Pseudomonas brassicacearum]|nr:hypothetical protein CD58_17950 [Pseudomonas brassicacearum]